MFPRTPSSHPFSTSFIPRISPLFARVSCLRDNDFKRFAPAPPRPARSEMTKDESFSVPPPPTPAVGARVPRSGLMVAALTFYGLVIKLMIFLFHHKTLKSMAIDFAFAFAAAQRARTKGSPIGCHGVQAGVVCFIASHPLTLGVLSILFFPLFPASKVPTGHWVCVLVLLFMTLLKSIRFVTPAIASLVACCWGEASCSWRVSWC